MSNFFSTENRAGVGYGYGIADATASQGPYDLGAIVRAQDNATSLGTGEFIYLKSNAVEKIGSVVAYNIAAGTTTLIATTDERTGYPVAVSMATKATTGMYGWYQFSGTAVMRKGVVDFGFPSKIYTSKVSAGYVTSAAASGNQILGAETANTASVSSTTSLINVTIDRPALQGQIT
jgi:hypothetical protein